MAATTLPKTLSKIDNGTILRLEKLIHPIELVMGKSFSWSPKENIVFADKNRLNQNEGLLALFHEIGHALLKHKAYSSDVDLLLKEVAAWEKAKKLATKFSVKIDYEHIEDCLDTYRDWLYRRSKCPNCGINSLQTTPKEYECINCAQKWQVSSSRFCRSYRLTKIEQD